LPSKKARYLILVIAMARYPTKLTAGKVIDLSFNSFGAVSNFVHTFRPHYNNNKEKLV